jgi:hypothetical protein
VTRVARRSQARPASHRRRPGLRPPAGRASLAFALALAGAQPAAAGGLDFDLLGARAIGRAGTSTVSGDGGAALVMNPAGLARSSSLRVQLGLALHDDDASYRAPDSAAAMSPTVIDRSEPALTPSAAVHGALGPIVVGVALLELGHLDRLLPEPEFGEMVEDVIRLYPHRYGGLALSYRRRVAVVGAAIRVGDWLGLGLSVGGSDVELAERRRVWAGFAGRDPLGIPTRDLDLTLSARDRVVPFASAGVLVAPPSLPIELALAVAASGDAFLDGDVALARTADADFPVVDTDPGEREAELRLGLPTTARAGARYLGERFLVELGADLTWLRDAGKVPVWQARGIAVIDQTGAVAAMGEVPSLVSQRNHAAVRGAVDVEVVPGLLWLTAGYAYATAATGRSHMSPGFGDTGGHTLSLGAEGTWNQITLALGIARRISRAVALMPAESDVFMENPFDAGTASAGAGRHERSHDAVGLTMEVAWE